VLNLISWPSPLESRVDLFDTKSTLLFNTPLSIATVYRENWAKKTFIIDASASEAAPGTTIVDYHWIVTKGDPNNVVITPLNAEGSRISIELDWHDTTLVTNSPFVDQDVYTNLFAIALVVESDKGAYSDAAFFTSYSMPNEQRVIADELTQSITYDTTSGPGRSTTDWSFYTHKAWTKDTYNYDVSNNLTGWNRLGAIGAGEYSASGDLITRDGGGAIIDTQTPVYQVVSNKLTPVF
jgi:hypothetical protein